MLCLVHFSPATSHVRGNTCALCLSCSLETYHERAGYVSRWVVAGGWWWRRRVRVKLFKAILPFCNRVRPLVLAVLVIHLSTVLYTTMANHFMPPAAWNEMRFVWSGCGNDAAAVAAPHREDGLDRNQTTSTTKSILASTHTLGTPSSWPARITASCRERAAQHTDKVRAATGAKSVARHKAELFACLM